MMIQQSWLLTSAWKPRPPTVSIKAFLHRHVLGEHQPASCFAVGHRRALSAGGQRAVYPGSPWPPWDASLCVSPSSCSLRLLFPSLDCAQQARLHRLPLLGPSVGSLPSRLFFPDFFHIAVSVCVSVSTSFSSRIPASSPTPSLFLLHLPPIPFSIRAPFLCPPQPYLYSTSVRILICLLPTPPPSPASSPFS